MNVGLRFLREREARVCSDAFANTEVVPSIGWRMHTRGRFCREGGRAQCLAQCVEMCDRTELSFGFSRTVELKNAFLVQMCKAAKAEMHIGGAV